MTEALQSTEPQGLGVIQGLMQSLIDKGGGVEAIRELVILHREEQDRAAAREFAADFAEFQATCPPIPRTSKSKKGATESGARASFEFTYASLDEIADTVRPHLHQHGFSYTWDATVTDNIVTATATLRHRNGHSITASFACPVDSSAHMNPMQKV